MKPKCMEQTFHGVHEHKNSEGNKTPDIRPRKDRDTIGCLNRVPHDQPEEYLSQLTVSK